MLVSSLFLPIDSTVVEFDIMCHLLQVCRGTAVMLVSPTDGTDEIANPFLADGA
jgi:hypothetical protein